MLRFVLLFSCFVSFASGLYYESHCLLPDSRQLCESCKTGWWGDRCERTCKGHCDTAGCHHINGSCWGCGAGYYTEGCTTPCPDNCYPSYKQSVFCHRVTGACLEGCRHGWWGTWCEKECSTECEGGVCYEHNGKCIKSCNPGWSGEWCNVPCPALCALAPDGGKYCHWNTRKCRDGCTDGWWGSICELECSSNCISKSCYYGNGSCTEGCMAGWTGDRCDARCSSGCRDEICLRDGMQKCSYGCRPGFYGHHCNKTCNIHCINRECSHDHQLKSTVCTHGCVEGWWSHNCRKRCLGTCEACVWETGRCHEGEKSLDDTFRPAAAITNGAQRHGITLTNPVCSLLLSIFALLSW